MAAQTLRRAFLTNQSDASFPSKIPTITEPSTGTGIIAATGTTLELHPYGTGADNTTYSIRVIGWRKILHTPTATQFLWTPTIVAELLCTNSAAVGIALSPLATTERFADTITLGSGIAVLFSPANDTPARALLDIDGFDKIEFTFDMTGATDANVLFCQY